MLYLIPLLQSQKKTPLSDIFLMVQLSTVSRKTQTGGLLGYERCEYRSLRREAKNVGGRRNEERRLSCACGENTSFAEEES